MTPEANPRQISCIGFAFFFLFTLITMIPAPAMGQDAATPSGVETVHLDDILITGTPLKDSTETPNMTSVIPSALLQGIGTTLDSAVKRQPGIDVQRQQEVGGALDDESIKIRGFGARRIQVAIDGRPLNTPGTAGGYFVDWTMIPLSNVERIDIIKGVSDPRYGNTLGGVIDLRTKRPGTLPDTQVQTSMGSYGSKMADFFHGWKPNQFEYSISGGYAESNGYLLNGDFTIKNMNLHLGLDLPWDGRIRGDIQYVDVRKGFIVNNRWSKNYDSPFYELPKIRRYPASDGEFMYGGMGAYPETGSWWKRERFNITVGYEQSLEKGTLDVRFWQNHADREAFNTRTSLNRVFHKEFYDDRSYGADSNFTYDFGSHKLRTGIEYIILKDDGDRNLSGDYRPSFRNGNYVHSANTGVYLIDDISFVNKTVTLTPGLRYTSFEGKPGSAGRAEGIPSDSFSGIAPSLKITYAPRENSLVYASIARALRVPTLPEYYWHYSPDAGVYTGNLPFKKEDGLIIQVGWKQIFPTQTKIEVSPYYYDIKNYIQFDLINFVSYNINRARIYGCEFGISQQLSDSFSLFANYTFQKSKTDGDPFVARFVNPADRDFNEIPGLPEHKVNVGLQYKGPRREKITLYMTAVSDQKVIYNNNILYDDNLFVRTQKGWATFDIEASYPVAKKIDLTGYVYNILNAQYQERFGYQAAGTNFGIGIKAAF